MEKKGNKTGFLKPLRTSPTYATDTGVSYFRDIGKREIRKNGKRKNMHQAEK